MKENKNAPSDGVDWILANDNFEKAKKAEEIIKAFNEAKEIWRESHINYRPLKPYRVEDINHILGLLTTEPDSLYIKDDNEHHTHKNIKTSWKNLCNEYVRAFCERHEIENIEYEIENDYIWVGSDPGSIACISDMYISMSDMRYDVDNNINPEYFTKWYWTAVERAELCIQYMNYESFCKGCPDPVSPEKLEQIKAAQMGMLHAKQLFEDAIKDCKIPDNSLENSVF